MKKRLAIAAAVTAGAIAVPLSIGSSHREAPNIAMDPTADNTDVYAFTALDAPDSLTMVANWIPFEDPAGGPIFYRFDDRARYYINVDNPGAGRADIRYRFTFKTRLRTPNSFLAAVPVVTSLDDPDLNITQSYDVVRETMRRDRVVRSKRVGRGLPVAPSNIGPKTMPDYSALAAGAIRTMSGGGKVFAGQRDDPFFVDLGATFDAVNLRNGTGNAGGGKDDLAGYNVHSIVMQVPEAQVTRDGRPVSAPDARNAVVGVWSSTERRRLEVTNADFDEEVLANNSRGRTERVRSRTERRTETRQTPASTARTGRNGRRSSDANFVQVSRLGNPLVNEVVIPAGKKDAFNRRSPNGDAKRFGSFVLKPELAGILNALFDVNAPTRNRTDIVQALLQGIPGLNQLDRGKSPLPTDTLKINLGVPPADTPNRFGVLAGDNAGFPNGRRLEDDVVDIYVQLYAGFLRGNRLPLGDGVDQDDQAFLTQFPYQSEPKSGFENPVSDRKEPTHAPTAPGNNPPTPIGSR
ncbi:MAG: DUF4331 domain-containing protein [Gemmatimonadetes bacterium]|nr:DUF4331 domain-containing protein [Gemmatimonadota bacterium]